MDPTFWSGFWGNVGDLWWLIFPIMGVAGGIGRRWQIASRERHERRLETLRLKSELKTAELQARGISAASGRRVGAQPAAQPASVAPSELLERLFKEHDEITARWLDYELDVAKLIAYPAMSDGRQPLTAAFLRAKKTADALRPASADAKVDEQRVSEYLDAVGNYAVAFEVAERDARRIRDSGFTADERKRLDRAQHMLKVALDESATQSERQVAYKRVRDELDGLIVLSDDAVDVLEKQVAGELTPGGDAPPTPAPEPERMPLKRDDPAV
ncbi:hypothetical protein Q9R19_08595 [Microbacterium sp. ARD32]|uniref:hypothetical protein n=1 Tax=Microbacterium sp. ARD32 TaxID=2962577 RepID=UPI002882362B|nr:hypothetical protein [Microbacterium sp. ARD32]MDT0157679.1 hypothetical protein [Microbacterium sp. ARD32]